MSSPRLSSQLYVPAHSPIYLKDNESWRDKGQLTRKNSEPIRLIKPPSPDRNFQFSLSVVNFWSIRVNVPACHSQHHLIRQTLPLRAQTSCYAFHDSAERKLRKKAKKTRQPDFSFSLVELKASPCWSTSSNSVTQGSPPVSNRRVESRLPVWINSHLALTSLLIRTCRKLQQ